MVVGQGCFFAVKRMSLLRNKSYTTQKDRDFGPSNRWLYFSSFGVRCVCVCVCLFIHLAHAAIVMCFALICLSLLIFSPIVALIRHFYFSFHIIHSLTTISLCMNMNTSFTPSRLFAPIYVLWIVSERRNKDLKRTRDIWKSYQFSNHTHCLTLIGFFFFFFFSFLENKI